MSLGLHVRPFRFPLIVAYDVTAWVGATLAATGLRYTSLSAVPWKASVVLGVALAAVYVFVGLAVRLHQGRARTGSLEEMSLVAGFVPFTSDNGRSTPSTKHPSSR